MAFGNFGTTLKKYFDGHPLCDVPTVSPVKSMTDDEWRALMEHWKDSHNIVSLFMKIKVVVLYMHMYSVTNSNFVAVDL